MRDGIVLRICRGESCGLSSGPVIDAARQHAEQPALCGRVAVEEVTCLSSCPLGPNILVERWRGGKRNDRAVIEVLRGGQHPDAMLVHDARADDVTAMIDWFVEAWGFAAKAP